MNSTNDTASWSYFRVFLVGAASGLAAATLGYLALRRSKGPHKIHHHRPRQKHDHEKKGCCHGDSDSKSDHGHE